MFEQKVDLRSRKAMTAFLKNHFRYNTMNTWNQSTSYANNVKLHNLDIPDDKMDKAYSIVCDDVDTFEYDIQVRDIMNDFMNETGYAMGFNGRSSGYIVLYDTERDPKTGKISVYPGRNIDMYEDFEDWTIDELRDRVKLVTKFDEYCDKIRDTFLDILENYEIEEQEEMVPITRKILQPIV